MRNADCKFVFSCILLTCAVFLFGCKRNEAIGNSAQQSPSGSEAQARSEVTTNQEPVPAPEIESQRQQVAEALGKCEAAMKSIYNKKIKAESLLTGALESYLDEGGFQTEKRMEQARAVVREQNKSKQEFARWREQLLKIKESTHGSVREEAAVALEKVEAMAKKFEKGLNPSR